MRPFQSIRRNCMTIEPIRIWMFKCRLLVNVMSMSSIRHMQVWNDSFSWSIESNVFPTDIDAVTPSEQSSSMKNSSSSQLGESREDQTIQVEESTPQPYERNVQSPLTQESQTDPNITKNTQQYKQFIGPINEAEYCDLKTEYWIDFLVWYVAACNLLLERIVLLESICLILFRNRMTTEISIPFILRMFKYLIGFGTQF